MGMSGAYTGPGTDEASQYIRTIHPALAERVSRFEENVARSIQRIQTRQRFGASSSTAPTTCWSTSPWTPHRNNRPPPA
jgi:hypothetical protein